MSQEDWTDRLSDSLRRHETDRREGSGPRFRYRILEELSRGGMGVVYRALDPQLGREVALKVLLEHGNGTAEGRERFARESQLAARLHHPNIVPVYDTGEHEGRAFLAMQLIDGTTLEKAKPDLRTALAAVRDAALALDYAHVQGVIHRDVKPSNLMLDRQGRIYVADFGVARAPGIAAQLTLPGVVVGTPAYMSPEQARGTDVDGRADVYALGATLYELATGQAPYPGADRREVLEAVGGTAPPPPRAIRPDLSRNVEAIILKAMDRDLRDRYSTAGALAEDIDRYLRGDRPLARPRGRLYPMLRAFRRHPIRSATTVLLIALLAFVLMLLGYFIRAYQSLGAARVEGNPVRRRELLLRAVAFFPEARERLAAVEAELAQSRQPPVEPPPEPVLERIRKAHLLLEAGDTRGALPVVLELETLAPPQFRELLDRLRAIEFAAGWKELDAAPTPEEFAARYRTLRGAEYDRVADRDAKLARSALALGLRLADRSEAAPAIHWLTEAERLGSTARELFERRGLLHVAAGAWKEAERDYAISERGRLASQRPNPAFSALFRQQAAEAGGRGDWKAALRLLDQALTLHPRDAQAIHDHGVARFRADGLAPEALEELKSALAIDAALRPSRVFAEAALAISKARSDAWKLEDEPARKEAWKAASDALDLAIEKVLPGDGALLLERARMRRRLGDFAGSIRDAAEAGDAANAPLVRGQAEYGAPGAEAALRSFEAAAARTPRSAAPRYWKGVCLQALGKPAEAKEELLAAVSLGFDGPDLHARLAALALEQKRWADVAGRANRVLETAAAVSEDEVFARHRGSASREAEIRRLRRDAHFLTARARFETGEYEKSVEECDRALLEDLAYGPAQFRKGYALYQLRRHDDAIKAFGLAITLGPGDAAPYIGRATTLAERGRSEEALRDYDAALRIEPDNYSALGGRGLLRAEKGLVPDAREDLKRALELAPHNWRFREIIQKTLSGLK
jgi:tetratricopeptide (TPR) repeat protein/predicted Ser/Thr protein kinase